MISSALPPAWSACNIKVCALCEDAERVTTPPLDIAIASVSDAEPILPASGIIKLFASVTTSPLDMVMAVASLELLMPAIPSLPTFVNGIYNSYAYGLVPNTSVSQAAFNFVILSALEIADAAGASLNFFFVATLAACASLSPASNAFI